MNKPLALDLFCKAGGATKGLQLAGFEVVGVDIEPQPRYCGDHFVQADAATFSLEGFDFLWASPPCQKHTRAQRIRANDHPDFIPVIRARFKESGALTVIENVGGAPLERPIELCGSMFGLRTYRHRLFECSFPIKPPVHWGHFAPNAKMGRPVKAHEFIHVVGNFAGVNLAREAMEIPWMIRDELREAIPPAYSQFIGQAALAHIRSRREAA